MKRAALERVGFAEVAHLAAEPDTKRARAELRPAIEAVLNAQGHEDMEDEERERIVAEALDDVVGLGSLQELIEDEAVSEIMVNGCTSTYIERKGTLHPTSPSSTMTSRSGSSSIGFCRRWVAAWTSGAPS